MLRRAVSDDGGAAFFVSARGGPMSEQAAKYLVEDAPDDERVLTQIVTFRTDAMGWIKLYRLAQHERRPAAVVLRSLIDEACERKGVATDQRTSAVARRNTANRAA